MENKTWTCPICKNNAYQRFGGTTVPAKKIYIKDGIETIKEIRYRFGQHFMCKGCSVFFNNPNLFNASNIKS